MRETLYQKDLAGNMKVWEIEVSKNIHEGVDIIIYSGRMNGSLTKNTTNITEGKNAGKANETSAYTQALSEAKSKIDSKIREGYVRDMADAKSSHVLGSGIPQPMLAQKHSPDGSQHSSKTLAQIKILGKKIIVQPKLDGNRCLIVVKDGVPQMYTRKGDLMPVQLNHILNDVKSKLGLTTDIVLDGELFSTEISFNVLNGLIKRVTVTKEDLNERLKIKYNLYDVVCPLGYEHRKNIILQYEAPNVLIVPSTEIVATDENVKAKLEEFLGEGHEGLMIRQLGIGYENKRTWQLCKVKIFEDEEFKLVGLEEDARGGFVGTFVMEMKDGRIFRAGASGQGVDERTRMWHNHDEYVGKRATIEFFGYSEYGIPRFPKFKGVRENVE